ncbi:Sideroflexin-4 [Oryzias melastigma]|uniref:Sideroflexin-4 n=1 Tax=Oryzias melastigma TaxID=30732 RepID=A0A834F978_ORYME|nr:Sideroflexin-4 [Oryzias melastigma]
MDPNLQLLKTQSLSFFGRVRMWFDLLDPSLLLASDPEIVKVHTLVGSEEKLHEKEKPSVTLSLSSVHADSGDVIPLLFRAPAFLPIAGPVVVASLLPHTTVKPALFWQFLLQSYNAGFSHANRNSSAEQVRKTSPIQLLLIAGTVSYTSVAAAFPQIVINRLNIRSLAVQTVCRTVVPIPLSAVLAFLNVYTVRSEETESGIRVFDCHGNPVGMSKAAGEKVKPMEEHHCSQESSN